MGVDVICEEHCTWLRSRRERSKSMTHDTCRIILRSETEVCNCHAITIPSLLLHYDLHENHMDRICQLRGTVLERTGVLFETDRICPGHIPYIMRICSTGLPLVCRTSLGFSDCLSSRFPIRTSAREMSIYIHRKLRESTNLSTNLCLLMARPTFAY